MSEKEPRRIKHRLAGMQDVRLEFRDVENMTRSQFKRYSAREHREGRAMQQRIDAIDTEIELSGTIFVRKHEKDT